ncbi:unnamed protein product [[Candida] boidinii]|uniref:Unnamed protein product n=1 Tax=Candida boidinii TaxID=5477 RepID=A0A9W6SVT9_CANBO|nr:hypothetical protein B5S30_g3054 [[Candida] boidinii]OWB83160.1 hypothetical protein B5S33_g1789 [[Candida] boidinii]GME67255.1 unnamed protein product [[Candida] boidinii]GME91316.1 unnamed protein product [[Candida] boidinii]GMF59296.1 unnamed protein product [[Candida] boidinii]
MVKLTEVEEAEAATVEAIVNAVEEVEAEAQAEAQAEAETEEAIKAVEKEFAAAEEEDDDEDEEDDEDDEDDFEDDFDEDETIYERIVALKDIIPAGQRKSLYNTVSSIQSLATTGVFTTGSLIWYGATTALFLGVPLALSIVGETQLIELEKQMNPAAAAAAGGVAGQDELLTVANETPATA